MATQKKLGSIPVDDRAMQRALDGKAEGGAYVGAGDNMLDFQQASSFINEDNSGKRFQIRISNKTADDQKINLNPTLEVEGYENLKEGTIKADLTAVGAPRSIDVLLAYLKANPTRVQNMSFLVDSIEQLDEPIMQRTETPWKSFSEEQRIPSDFQDGSTQNLNKVTVDDISGWRMSPMHTMLYKLKAGKTVTISFIFGASLDCAEALNKKAIEAAENVTVAYARSSK